MKKPTVANVCRWESNLSNRTRWDVAVYWSYDPNKYPQDYDLFFDPSDWRKFSKCRSPKPGETMRVLITIEVVD